ncbi:MAG: Ig-like domain-containing protein [Rhizobium sp.]|nr:Ig-like domain-containing protein [Rhizobium sp.]MBX9455838.1 Ig-like domain-containing protein [Rhizobium sp.]
MADYEVELQEGSTYNIIELFNQHLTLNPLEYVGPIYNSTYMNIKIQTVSLSATGGFDFNSINTSFAWNTYSQTTPNINIIADGQSEGEEQFEIVLTASSDGFLGGTRSYSYLIKIKDNGSGPTDTTAPSIEQVFPPSGSDFDLKTNLQLHFSEQISFGTGSIVLLKDGTVIETFSAGSDRMRIGSTIVTLDPTDDLVASSRYTIKINAGAVKDGAGNANSFATFDIDVPDVKDTTPPTITNFTTSDGATADLDSNLVLTFSEAISASSGSIELYKVENNQHVHVESFALNGSRVKISGSTVTIDPTEDFDYGVDYLIDLGDVIIKDAAGNQNETIGEYTFKSEAKAVVSITQDPITMSEGDSDQPTTLSFRVTLDRALSKDLTVEFDVRGTAVPLVEFELESPMNLEHTQGKVVIPAGKTFADIRLFYKPDTRYEPSGETLSIQLWAGPDYDLPGGAFSWTSADITIKDDDDPLLKLNSGMEEGAEFKKREGMQVDGERMVVRGGYEQTPTGDFVAEGTNIKANVPGSGLSGLISNLEGEMAIAAHEWIGREFESGEEANFQRALAASSSVDPALRTSVLEALANINGFVGGLFNDQLADLAKLVADIRNPSAASWDGGDFAEQYEEGIEEFSSRVMEQLETAINGHALEAALRLELPRIQAIIEEFIDSQRLIVSTTVAGDLIAFLYDIDTSVDPMGWNVPAGRQGVFYGLAGADEFYGNSARDCLIGFAGNDYLEGGGGNDSLVGGSGVDKIWGGVGSDRVWGGAGNDRISGEKGRDFLSGGEGADTFVYWSLADSPWKRGMMDSILDFDPSEDKIDLRAIDANANKSGNQAFRWVGYSSDYSGQGELDYWYHKGTTFVFGYLDRDKQPDFQLNIDDKVKLDAGDFIL